MNWILIGGGILLLLILLRVFTSGGIYKAIFKPEHYVEFASSLSTAVAAGCDLLNELPINPPTDDPRTFVTSGRVTLLYTVDQEEGNYEHHYSISIAGHYTPHAVGGGFTVYVAHLLGLDPTKLHLGISQRQVFHTAFTLNETEQAKFEEREILIPSLEESQAIFSECIEQSQTLNFEQFHIEAP